MSKEANVDFAFDLHLDASPDPKTSRMGVWYHDTAKTEDAGVAFNMVRYLNMVGIKTAAKPMLLSDDRDGFAETHEKFGIPALVVEIEFITNQDALNRAIERSGELMTNLALAINAGLRGKGLVP
jgi:N-acetylmuramoyl-L-alanine amidase